MPTHLERDFPPTATQDFWRTPAANGAVPDGVNDPTEDIARTGKVGIGLAAATAPTARLDIADGGRSGALVSPPAGSPFYVTGALTGLGEGAVNPATPTANLAELRHSNTTQGVGFAYDGVYVTGSNPNESFNLMQRGAGQFFFRHQALLGGINYVNWCGADLAGAGQGWYHRYYEAGAQAAGDLIRRTSEAFGDPGMERFFQLRAASGGLANAFALRPSPTLANAYSAVLDGNTVHDQKLVLFGYPGTAFYGFGIKGSTLASFVSANSGFFRWYQGASPGTQVFSVSGVGNVAVDPSGVGPAGWSSPVLRFGGESSNEGIRSQRVGADTFLNDLEFYTNGARRLAVKNGGRIWVNLAGLPGPFATDALAGASGVLQGEIYRTASVTIPGVTLLAVKL